ncbi:MAG: alpha/beta hydrolase fold [Frankiales bacterium]|nr:alpha/beta hydrolase fold [Frankiales bacterium]
MTTVPVPGAELYVERAGDGPPLLSISGSGSALADGLRPAVLPFAKAFDVAGWDHRGLGQSTSDGSPVTMADFAADALAVADSLGWQEFSVFGVSFGGMVAQELAVTAPERVTRLVLGCTSAGGAGGSSYPLHERPDLAAMALLVDTRPGAAAGLMALMGSVRAVPKEPGYELQLQARRAHDVWDRLGRITAATLVQAGRYDGIAPPENSARIASRIEGSVLQEYEGGHAFYFQDGAAWDDAVAFLHEG